MNTANLQLEGLLLAIASVLTAMKRKGVLTEEEIDAALASAEVNATNEPLRPTELSDANIDAICFPIRFLRLATDRSTGDKPPSFVEITAMVAQSKPD